MENTPTRMPSKRALAVLDEPPPTEPINKTLRITEKVRRAIGLMVSGECKHITEAAAKGWARARVAVTSENQVAQKLDLPRAGRGNRGEASGSAGNRAKSSELRRPSANL